MEDLCDVVRARCYLDLPGKDGSTPREHYEQAKKEIENDPEVPLCVQHVWDWFLDLAGSEEITYVELRAWVDMTGNLPNPMEIDMLRAMFRTRQEALSGG